jgi:hypothetical protein
MKKPWEYESQGSRLRSEPSACNLWGCTFQITLRLP